MVNFNRVFLVGNLTKDPELRYTPQGTAVTTLRIAVNSPFKDKSGQPQKETCFINVVAWGQIAEVCNQYLQKGRSVLVEGRLQSRSWKTNEGQNRSVIEVCANRVQFMPQAAPVKTEGKGVDLGEEPEQVNLESTDSAAPDATGDNQE
jgi:single-strand DNA-binding protein